MIIKPQKSDHHRSSPQSIECDRRYVNFHSWINQGHIILEDIFMWIAEFQRLFRDDVFITSIESGVDFREKRNFQSVCKNMCSAPIKAHLNLTKHNKTEVHQNPLSKTNFRMLSLQDWAASYLFVQWLDDWNWAYHTPHSNPSVARLENRRYIQCLEQGHTQSLLLTLNFETLFDCPMKLSPEISWFRWHAHCILTH